MNIYKTVFDTEEQGKEVLIEKGVWEEVTDENDVTSMQYINGTKSVVGIGRIVDEPADIDAKGKVVAPAVYFDGWAYDILTEDTIDFGKFEVFPDEDSVHSFFGY